MRRRQFFVSLSIFAIALICPSMASAFIMKLTPLSELVNGDQFIFVAKVQEVLPDKPGLILVVSENLKGKAPFDRMPVNLTGDSSAKLDRCHSRPDLTEVNVAIWLQRPE